MADIGTQPSDIGFDGIKFADQPDIRPLTIAATPPATCEKLHWSVHGETPAQISIRGASHSPQPTGRCGQNTAYDETQDYPNSRREVGAQVTIRNLSNDRGIAYGADFIYTTKMLPRPLTRFETPIAAAVVNLGAAQNWEFAAYLETQRGRLIELRTLMRDDGADPSRDVHDKAAAGAPIVVHHNHLSQESLSFADWNGLATVFDETFAHCADGTIYWGRVCSHSCVRQIICCSAQMIEMNAENHLFSILNELGDPRAPALASFFRKEVVNRAMGLRGFVEYAFSWGTGNVPPYVRLGAASAPGPAGINGSYFNNQIDQAAVLLAPSL